MPTTTRFYTTPKIGTGMASDPIRPQFFVDSEGLSWIGGSLTCQDYGGEPTYFVTAQVTDEEHAQLAGAPGVVVIVPEPPRDGVLPLDTGVGLYDETLRTSLEDQGFPARWIELGTTYRAVIRHLQRCIHLAQRMQRFGRLFPGGLTLDALLVDVPAAQRRLMIDAVVAGGGTGDVLRGTQTLGTAITLLADQLPYPALLLDVKL